MELRPILTFTNGDIEPIYCLFCGKLLHEGEWELLRSLTGRRGYFCRPAEGMAAEDTCYEQWRTIGHSTKHT